MELLVWWINIIREKLLPILYFYLLSLYTESRTCSIFYRTVMGSVSAEDIDIDFLPNFYDIIKCVERESTESALAKRSEYLESSQKVVEFQKKLDLIREQVKKLPGIDYSKEDQLKKLEALRKQLVLKKKLLQKYKDMCALEGVKQYLTPSSSA